MRVEKYFTFKLKKGFYSKNMKSKVRFYIWLSLLFIGIVLFVIEGIDNKDALSWAEMLVVICYILVVRRKLRPFIIKKWKYFEEKPSAPYIIGFIILLTLCAFLLILHLEPVAEEIATIAYFLLVVGVGIEFYQLITAQKKESG